MQIQRATNCTLVQSKYSLLSCLYHYHHHYADDIFVNIAGLTKILQSYNPKDKTVVLLAKYFFNTPSVIVSYAVSRLELDHQSWFRPQVSFPFFSSQTGIHMHAVLSLCITPLFQSPCEVLAQNNIRHVNDQYNQFGILHLCSESMPSGFLSSQWHKQDCRHVYVVIYGLTCVLCVIEHHWSQMSRELHLPQTELCHTQGYITYEVFISQQKCRSHPVMHSEHINRCTIYFI